MRLLPTLLLLAACTGRPGASTDGAASLDAVQVATDRWLAEPTPETIDAVSTAAARALDKPIGDLAYDVELARILNDVLLRPDLARPRIEPHVGALSEDQQGIWLNVLLRSNDTRKLAAELERLRGIKIRHNQPAVMAAAAQAKTFRQVDWEQAVYAFKAAEMIDDMPERGRKLLDLPFDDFPDAIELLLALLPDWPWRFAMARTTRQDETVPAMDPGAVPAMNNRRRVIGFIDTPDPVAARKLAHDTIAARHKQTITYSIIFDRPDGDPIQVCGEGRMEGDAYWSMSGCDPVTQARWMEAARYFTQSKRKGMSSDQAVAAVKERFPNAPFGE